ncbi:MAG: hypothetical protein DBX41_05200 [Clostridiales bacterium]|nr:MAG: hypothetical protein DBX41_05200 [Clostridiales bacterium]
MKFNGALVQLEDMVIAVAVDSADFLSLPQEEKMAKMRAYQSAFPKTPFVMLLDMGAGESEFFGRPDLVAKMREVPLNYITFKVYETKED